MKCLRSVSLRPCSARVLMNEAAGLLCSAVFRKVFFFIQATLLPVYSPALQEGTYQLLAYRRTVDDTLQSACCVCEPDVTFTRSQVGCTVAAVIADPGTHLLSGCLMSTLGNSTPALAAPCAQLAWRVSGPHFAAGLLPVGHFMFLPCL